MKAILFFVSLIFATPIFSQSAGSDSVSKNWKLDLFYSTDLYFSNSTIELSEYTGYNFDEKKYSYTVGANAIMNLSKNFDLGLGLNYSRKNYTINFYCHVCDLFYIQSEKAKLDFLEIPIFIRYNLPVKKFNFYVETGIEVSYIFNSNNLQHNEIETDDLFYNSRIGVGVSYTVSPKIELNLNSNYSNTIYNFQETKYKLRSIGIQTGVGIALGKME